MNVLIVDDERNIRESLSRLLALEGIDSVCAGGGREAQEILQREAFDVVVLDLRMPGMDGQELLGWIVSEGIRAPVVMVSAHGEIDDAVRALKAGAADYLVKPFDPDELVLRLRAAAAARKSADLVEAGERTSGAASRLVGESAAMRELRTTIDKAAATNATVLITGESGTGKELVARELHARSPRSSEPFVAVNIGAIHEELVESELFGHEKGAFTGANERKAGLFELAGRGSLFLDEIGEMPVHLQVKLLRVLQERRLRRVGGSRDIPVESRFIAATNRDIESLVSSGGFREDLYYRLNVVRIEVPPLRERREDIPLLAGCLLAKIAARMGRECPVLAPAALDALLGHTFPGNVRELENALERSLIYSDGKTIAAADLDLRGRACDEARHGDKEGDARQGEVDDDRRRRDETVPKNAAMDDIERAAIEEALERSGGNRTKAAEALGISRRTILYKIKRYGLD
jgi:two-component system response regulator AtoC